MKLRSKILSDFTPLILHVTTNIRSSAVSIAEQGGFEMGILNCRKFEINEITLFT